MKKVILVLFCLSILAAGSISVYFYLSSNPSNQYKDEMFVDGGENHEYAAVYGLRTCI